MTQTNIYTAGNMSLHGWKEVTSKVVKMSLARLQRFTSKVAKMSPARFEICH